MWFPRGEARLFPDALSELAFGAVSGPDPPVSLAGWEAAFPPRSRTLRSQGSRGAWDVVGSGHSSRGPARCSGLVGSTRSGPWMGTRWGTMPA